MLQLHYPKELRLTLTVPDVGAPSLRVVVLGGGTRTVTSESLFTSPSHSGTDLADECAGLVERFLAWKHEHSFVIEDSGAVGA
jgi:hypothetical protein